MSRIAVIQTAFPGDVILCTPVFESLKSAGHEAVAVVRPDAAPLLKNNPFVQQIIVYDKRGGPGSLIRAASALKSARCDAALIVQRYLKSGLLPLVADIPQRTGYDIAPAAFLYTDLIPYQTDSHEVERCLALCAGFSKTVGYTPKIFISDDEKQQTFDILKLHGLGRGNLIVLAPGSIWNTKRWVGYSALIDLIGEKSGYRIALLGSPADFEVCEAINKGAASVAVNLAGKTDLLVSAAIMQRAVLVIANDSAPAHLAAAVGTPVVAIFGPTSPKFGFAPYSSKCAIVENRYLYCRPCSTHGPQKCPEKHFRCMREIAAGDVWAAGEKLLSC